MGSADEQDANRVHAGMVKTSKPTIVNDIVLLPMIVAILGIILVAATVEKVYWLKNKTKKWRQS